MSHQFLTGLFLAIGAAIVAFFINFSTTRKAQCQGMLLPTAGVLRLMPSQSGVIKESRVSEGQIVQKGDVLFILSGERSSSSADSTQQVVSALLKGQRDSFFSELSQSGQQSRQRMANVQRRATDLGGELERLGDQIGMQTTRVSLSEQAYTRVEALQKTNFMSQAQLQEKQAELLDQRQRLADFRRAHSAILRELSNADAELRELQVQSQRDAAALERSISAVEQDLTESEARREILVRAPLGGMVTAITADVGQMVVGNTMLASLLPSGAALEAEIYATSRAAGFIKPGMTVLLRYQAYPYQKFGQYRAQVREVANTSLRPEELGVAMARSSGNGEPLYRIRLKLDKQSVLAYGKQMPLKSGMLVDASVHLEHRRLYEWVMEPLFSISGRL
ncbi:MAG: HlyD family efflux transporter periplasmic adaptor subunit [Pseudomonadota bacterium]